MSSASLSPRESSSHKKDVIAIRNWLHGRNFAMASFALEYASNYHTEKRKDKITPEFNHMIIIASYIRTVSDFLSYREEALALAFLHDLCEDKEVSFEKVQQDFEKAWESQEILYKRENLPLFDIKKFINALKLVTKKYNGTKTPPENYFPLMVNCPIASVIKGADRIHNFASCGRVFSNEKKKLYIKETVDFIIPMLKQSQRNFPHQNNVYENIKLFLKIEMDLIESSIK